MKAFRFVCLLIFLLQSVLQTLNSKRKSNIYSDLDEINYFLPYVDWSKMFKSDDWCNVFPSGQHTMCKYKGPSDACSNLTVFRTVDTIGQASIMNALNEQRNRVASGNQDGQPKASNMKKLVWSDALAEVAQRWVDQCDTLVNREHVHDTLRDNLDGSSVGQNGLFADAKMRADPDDYYDYESYDDCDRFNGWMTAEDEGTKIDFMKLIGGDTYAWYDEVRIFDGSLVSNYKFQSAYGYYSQVTWADTEEVGCGWVLMRDEDRNEPCVSWKYYVSILYCNFSPAGNLEGAQMYKIGEDASDCPAGFSRDAEYTALCSKDILDDWCIEFPSGQHTMCKYKGPSDACTNLTVFRTVDTTGQASIMNALNEQRNRVASGNQEGQPKASNMKKLVWSDALAEVAQRWVDQCDTVVKGEHVHDTLRDNLDGSSVGQNGLFANAKMQTRPGDYYDFESYGDCHKKYLGGGWMTAKDEETRIDLMKLMGGTTNVWYNEVSVFDGDLVSNYKFQSAYGHYSQVAWADTEEVGCGWVLMRNEDRNDPCIPWKYYINILYCNFSPAGNLEGAQMYKIGEGASDCPAGFLRDPKYTALCSKA